MTNFKRNRIPIMWMILAMFLFVSMDACGKFLLQSQSLVQIVWGRYFFHFLILILFLAGRIQSIIQTQNLKIQLIRSFFLLASTMCFFSGLKYIQLSQASSIMLLSPLLVTALSVPILRERVGIRRWLSIFIGFLGALIIIRPDFNFIYSGTSLTFCAAIFFAFYQISTRFLRNVDGVLTTLVYSSLIGVIILTPIVPYFWLPTDTRVWILMVLMGVLGGLGHFSLIMAFNGAEAAAIAPFTYTNVVWATILGFFIFNNLPDVFTIAGAITIISSGVYIYYRENFLITKKNQKDL